MKVFVDELSKTCDECPCRNEFFCSLTYERLSYSSLNYKRGNECPLELIADHDKEKDQHIAELEQENKELKVINYDSVRKSVYNLLQKCADAFYEEKEKLKEENTKLQEQLKNAIVLPKNFNLGQRVFMIPTDCNRLNKITAYTILSFSKSDIGLLADLSIVKKEKGVEPYFCAGFDMFNTIIFATEEEAKQHFKEIK